MATINTINVSVANDGNGDTLRNAFVKANDNFAELNSKKVEAELGKGLSENDFTDADKAKLDSALQPDDISTSLTETVTGKVADSTVSKVLNDKIVTLENELYANTWHEVAHGTGAGQFTYAVGLDSARYNSNTSGLIISAFYMSQATAYVILNASPRHFLNGSVTTGSFKSGGANTDLKFWAGCYQYGNPPAITSRTQNCMCFEVENTTMRFVVGASGVYTTSADVTINTGEGNSVDYYHYIIHRISNSAVYYKIFYGNVANVVLEGTVTTNIPTEQSIYLTGMNKYASPTNSSFYCGYIGFGRGITEILKQKFNLL